MRAWLLALAVLLFAGPAGAETPWDERWFPNVPLTTQDGEVVRFFDDLVEGKIVVINFIYTSCPDTCPLETAHLVRVQRLLGDRLGRDVFFYSISIDPEHDTPEVLKEYRERFGARWTFLTGKEEDVTLLRQKLGLYVPEIQNDPDNPGNHNVSMIIGNQATGQWMRRGPFENPYVLAEQIGNWLDGWRRPPSGRDYAQAPELRNVPRGEHVFRTRCAPCHDVRGEEAPGALGPDLAGVTDRRDRKWLVAWLRAPDRLLAEGDPTAVALYERYNRLAMPNMRLNEEEARDVLSYLEEASRGLARRASAAEAPARPSRGAVTVVDAWVRTPRPGARVNAGYMTLVNPGPEEVRLVGVRSDAFEQVEVHEMAMDDGQMEMRAVPELAIAPGGNVRLEPGGMHLMLREPRRELSREDEVRLILLFGSGREQRVTVPVADR